MPEDGQQDQNEQGNDDSGNESGGKSYSQAEVNRLVKERLNRERAQLTEKFKDYDSLKERASQLDALAEASKSEQERAVEKAAKEADERARGEMGREIARLRVAVEKGLPKDMASKVLSASKRLVGSTPEELAADAAEFFAAAPITPSARPPAPDRSQGQRAGAGAQTPGERMNALIRANAGYGQAPE